MFEVKGKVSTAICYATVAEDKAIDQIRTMCDNEFTRNSKVRIMPDVHAGKGCTIGTTMTVSKKVVPNIVGVDIGCGMYTVKLDRVDINFQEIDQVAHYVPSGMNVWDESIEYFDLTNLKCYSKLKDVKRLNRSLGTLGGGNHFIEIDCASDGTKYLIIHSGSRNLGKQVAELYQNLAIDLVCNKSDYLVQKDELIKTYKEQGLDCKIEHALETLKKNWLEKKSDIVEELCYLYGEPLKDYLHDIEICQRFAKRNREKIAQIILEKTGLRSVSSFHTIHNYIDTSEMILRKGAIAAHKDEVVLIPMNMRDGCILAKGKGNPEWNFSAPHGAGRIMSRTEARKKLDVESYKKTMSGIYSTSVNKNTIDESPMAYKSLNDIIDVIQESVEVIEILKPIYNFKSSS